jgi:DNA-binding transcriptional LysR family regulator
MPGSLAVKGPSTSTSNIRRFVRILEERVGVRLIERTTRSVAATPAGERLLEGLRPLLGPDLRSIGLA